MKLIVGLGNPGPRYAETRHNVGFAVLDEVGRRRGTSLSREKFHAWYGEAVFGGERVVLLKPSTFMNRSGQAVQAAGRFYQLERSDLLVVADDWALPLGHVRLRTEGSAGSHNGLQSVIESLGSNAFSRLRVGIGEAVGLPEQYVLSRFAADEVPLIEQGVQTAAEAVECWIEQGATAAMNRFNRRVREP